MKVKIGDKFYDSENEPIMLILGNDEKYNIEQMEEDCSTYCAYPENMTLEEALEFMGEYGK